MNLSVFPLFLADVSATVHGLQSIFQEQEMTENVHDSEGHGYLATFVGKNGRWALLPLSQHAKILQVLFSWKGEGSEFEWRMIALSLYQIF